MEVQLLRTPSGKVIFLESHSDFVDMLVGLLHAPLGALLQSCTEKEAATPSKLPFAGLAASVPRLRPAVFSAQKADVMPKAVCWKDALESRLGNSEETSCEVKGVGQWCLACLKSGHQYPLQQANRGCQNCYMLSKCRGNPVQYYCCSCGYSLSAPGERPHCDECGAQNTLVDCNIVRQRNFCAKCTASGKGGKQMMNGRTCASCKSKNTRACSSCSWCDACSIKQLGFEVAGLETDGRAPKSSFFKDMTKFMITNDLEVFEVSPVKMIELMAGKCDSFKGMKTTTMDITEERVKQLVLRALLGSEDVLTETFPADEAEAGKEVEVGSAIGTEDSFCMTFEANPEEVDS